MSESLWWWLLASGDMEDGRRFTWLVCNVGQEMSFVPGSGYLSRSFVETKSSSSYTMAGAGEEATGGRERSRWGR